VIHRADLRGFLQDGRAGPLSSPASLARLPGGSDNITARSPDRQIDPTARTGLIGTPHRSRRSASPPGSSRSAINGPASSSERRKGRGRKTSASWASVASTTSSPRPTAAATASQRDIEEKGQEGGRRGRRGDGTVRQSCAAASSGRTSPPWRAGSWRENGQQSEGTGRNTAEGSWGEGLAPRDSWRNGAALGRRSGHARRTKRALKARGDAEGNEGTREARATLVTWAGRAVRRIRHGGTPRQPNSSLRGRR
jgi:hypothetical protein